MGILTISAPIYIVRTQERKQDKINAVKIVPNVKRLLCKMDIVSEIVKLDWKCRVDLHQNVKNSENLITFSHLQRLSCIFLQINPSATFPCNQKIEFQKDVILLHVKPGIPIMKLEVGDIAVGLKSFNPTNSIFIVFHGAERCRTSS